jgi:hypothetical protein
MPQDELDLQKILCGDFGNLPFHPPDTFAMITMKY